MIHFVELLLVILLILKGPGTKGSSWCEKSKLSRETRVKVSSCEQLLWYERDMIINNYPSQLEVIIYK